MIGSEHSVECSMSILPKRCKGFIGTPCNSTRWDRVGVISAQKGTYLFQCQRCGRCVILKAEQIPETDDPLETL
jgi:hypothetical protein